MTGSFIDNQLRAAMALRQQGLTPGLPGYGYQLNQYASSLPGSESDPPIATGPGSNPTGGYSNPGYPGYVGGPSQNEVPQFRYDAYARDPSDLGPGYSQPTYSQPNYPYGTNPQGVPYAGGVDSGPADYGPVTQYYAPGPYGNNPQGVPLAAPAGTWWERIKNTLAKINSAGGGNEGGGGYGGSPSGVFDMANYGGLQSAPGGLFGFGGGGAGKHQWSKPLLTY